MILKIHWGDVVPMYMNGVSARLSLGVDTKYYNIAAYGRYGMPAA